MTSAQLATTRELQVLSLLSEGKSAKEIASDLYISTHTVESHKRNLIDKIKARNTLHMVVKAIRMGMVCMVMLFCSKTNAQISMEDSLILHRNLDSLHYGDSWYNTSYTDTIGLIWNKYATAPEDVFVGFFNDYFSQRYYTLNLANYLWYPSYAWYSDAVRLRVQRALIGSLCKLNRRLLNSTIDDIALSDSMQNNLFFKESLREIHQAFPSNFSQEGSRFIDLQSRDSIVNSAIWTIENYPQFFEKSSIIDHILYPALYTIKAQIYANLAAAVHLDQSIKPLIHVTLKMDDVYSELQKKMWNDHSILIIENSKTDSSLLRVFLNYAEKIPTDLHEWILCNQTIDMDSSMGKWYVSNSHYGKIRFNTPAIPQVSTYTFPQESKGALTESFTIDNVAELASSIYTKTIRRIHPELKLYLDSLLSRAGEEIDNYAFNRSHLVDGYYTGHPDWLFGDEFRMYIADADAFLDLALERWDDSRPHAMSQFMLFTNLFALNSDSTIFYSVDELGEWTCDKYKVVKDIDGFITTLYLNDSCHYVFTLDADKMVINVILNTALCYPEYDCPVACSNDTSYPDFCALMDFYESTCGAEWKNNDGWRDGYEGLDCNYCDWYGVVCDGNNRVIRFNLNHNEMGGNVPESFGELSKLEQINFWDNNLYGKLPSSFFNLSNLTWFSAGYNGFKGQLDPFCSLTNLTNLYLPNNLFSGEIPMCVGSLTKLYYFNIYTNRLSGTIPDEFYNLEELRRIEIGRNSFSGTISPDIGNLEHLDLIGIDRNQFSGEIPEEVGHLNSLKYFRIEENEFFGAIPDVFHNAPVESFVVHHNNFTGPLPVSIVNAGRIRHLEIQNNKFSGCIPYGYKSFCNAYPSNEWSYYNISNNPNLDHDNWTEFCNNSTGICDGVTLLYPTAYDTIDNGCSNDMNDINWVFKWYDGQMGEKVHLEIYNTASSSIYWQDDNLDPDGEETYMPTTSIEEDQLNAFQWRMRSYVSGTWSAWTDYTNIVVESLNADCVGCTDPYSHNYNSYYEINDGSCETCSDNILNGDEEGVDCGGGLCYPCEASMCNTITVFGNATRLDIDLEDRIQQRLYQASYQSVNKITIDTANERVFFIESTKGYLGVSSFRGENSSTIFDFPQDSRRFVSIVYHPELDRVLAADEYNDEILSIAPDGSVHEVFIKTSVSYYTKLLVGPDYHLYWNNTDFRQIKRVDSSGSCIETWKNTISRPESFAIDFSNARLYIGEFYTGILRFIDLFSGELTQLQDYNSRIEDMSVRPDGDLIIILDYPNYELVRTDDVGVVKEIIKTNFYGVQALVLGDIAYIPEYRGYSEWDGVNFQYYSFLSSSATVYSMWSAKGVSYYATYNRIYSYIPQSNAEPIQESGIAPMRNIAYDSEDDVLLGLSRENSIYTIDDNWDTTIVARADSGYYDKMILDTTNNQIYIVNIQYGSNGFTEIIKIDYQGNKTRILSLGYGTNMLLSLDLMNNRLLVYESYEGDYAIYSIDASTGMYKNSFGSSDSRYLRAIEYHEGSNSLFLLSYHLLERLNLNTLEKTVYVRGAHVNGNGLYIYRPTSCDPCYNGIQDGAETGVDCGGSCKPCEECENITEMIHGEIPDNTFMEIEHWVMTDGYIMPGSKVMLQAGDEITLMEGTEIDHGALASFDIDPCTPPGNSSARSEMHKSKNTKRHLLKDIKDPITQSNLDRHSTELIKHLQQQISLLIALDAESNKMEIRALENEISDLFLR